MALSAQAFVPQPFPKYWNLSYRIGCIQQLFLFGQTSFPLSNTAFTPTPTIPCPEGHSQMHYVYSVSIQRNLYLHLLLPFTLLEHTRPSFLSTLTRSLSSFHKPYAVSFIDTLELCCDFVARTDIDDVLLGRRGTRGGMIFAFHPVMAGGTG